MDEGGFAAMPVGFALEPVGLCEVRFRAVRRTVSGFIAMALAVLLVCGVDLQHGLVHGLRQTPDQEKAVNLCRPRPPDRAWYPTAPGRQR